MSLIYVPFRCSFFSPERLQMRELASYEARPSRSCQVLIESVRLQLFILLLAHYHTLWYDVPTHISGMYLAWSRTRFDSTSCFGSCYLTKLAKIPSLQVAIIFTSSRVKSLWNVELVMQRMCSSMAPARASFVLRALSSIFVSCQTLSVVSTR